MKTQTLQHQFRLWTVLLVVVPSLLIMIIYSLEQIQVAKDKNLEVIGQRIDFQKRLIEFWIKERSENVRELSRTEAFRTLNEEQMRRALYEKQEHDNNFDSLSYIDKDGYFKMSTLSGGIHYPSAIDKPYFEAAQAGNEYISDVVIGHNSGQAIISFSDPIHDKAGNFQGLILGSVRMTTLAVLLHNSWIGQTGEVLLVNRQGVMLTEPRYIKELINKGLTKETAIMKLKLSDDALRNIRLGETGTASWTNYLDNKILGAYLDVPERGWTIIGKIDEREVLAPIYKQLAMMAGGIACLILLILPLATLVTNRLKRPIEWLIRQSNMVAAADYTIVGQEKCAEKVPHELVTLCETFVNMNHKIENTISLLKKNEAKLESKVSEIQEINARLEKEIMERQAVQKVLEKQIIREKMVAAFSTQLANCKTNKLGFYIKQMLAECGQLFNVSMSFVYLSFEKECEFRLKYYWRSENTCWDRIEGVNRLEFEKYPWVIQQLKEAGQVYLDTDHLPHDAAAEVQMMNNAQIKSMMLFPMTHGSDVIGFLGFANIGEQINWQEDQAALVKVIGELILNAVERHRIFQELSNSEADNRALVEAIPDGLLRISAQGRVVSAKLDNKKISSIFDEKQLISHNFASVIPHAIMELFSAAIVQAIVKGELQKFEYNIVNQGTTLYREVRIVPIRDHAVVAVVRDITEQKKAAEELIAMRDAIVNAQRMAALGVMAGSIAHEINQPLNSIEVSASGLLYLMKKGINLSTEDFQRELSRIVSEAKRIDHVISKTLDIVKRGASYKELLLIDEVLFRVLTLIKDQELFKNVRISVQLSLQKGCIAGNQAQIDEVLLHLLANAGQALQDNQGEKVICISVQVADTVIITVTDNGPGLQPAALEKIFEPFFTTGKTEQNMGLGLPIVQSIMYAHNGEVSAENVQGGGAAFRLSFPRVMHVSGSKGETG